LYFDPLTVTDLESRNAYTATLDSGNSFELRRTATYGQILIGVSGILLALLWVLNFIREAATNERDASESMEPDFGPDGRVQRPVSRFADRPRRGPAD